MRRAGRCRECVVAWRGTYTSEKPFALFTSGVWAVLFYTFQGF